MIDKNSFLNLAQEIGLLKKIQRTGWVLKGIKDVESVAEHSWRVAMFALFFSEKENVNILKLVKMALIHDLGEIIIGDVKWEQGAKIIASQEIKHKDEYLAVKQIFADNTEFQEYIDLWKEFNEQKTNEAKVVKELDKLEMAVQAFEYQKEGYSPRLLEEFFENAEKYLKNGKFKEYFEFLMEERKKAINF